MEPKILTIIARDYDNGVLEFSNLKHTYLHQLFKPQHICEAKMFAPKLETIRVRGCWGVRRLPAVGRDNLPVVDCEKDWWEKLSETGRRPATTLPSSSRATRRITRSPCLECRFSGEPARHYSGLVVAR